MNGKATIRLLLACSLALTALGFYSSKNADPKTLGLLRANVDETGLLEMAVDQVRQDLQTAAPAALRKYKRAAAGIQDLQSGENILSESRESSPIARLDLRATAIRRQDDLAVVTADYIAPGATSGSTVTLTFRKEQNRWVLLQVEGVPSVFSMRGGANTKGYEIYRDSGAGHTTLSPTPVSRELGIDKLTRAVTRAKLDRQLFAKPFAGVLVSSVTQFNEAPYFISRYVQLVTDPAWNRIVYGDYDGWIRAYGNSGGPADLNRPHGIERDAHGNIYVADTGNHRIVVLRLNGSGPKPELRYAFDFGGNELDQPYDVAWDDGGTPFEPNDDLVWVLDRGSSQISGYRLDGQQATREIVFGKRGKGEDEFYAPESLAPGRFNGSCSGALYVADTGNRRIVKLSRTGAGLRWLDTFRFKEESQFTSIDVDHWGNLYFSDRSYSQIEKLTADFEPLASITGQGHSLASPADFRIIFGQVTLAAENRQVWAGYDQAFLLEKWSETTGAERFALGLDLADFSVSMAGSLDHLTATTKLTDHGQVMLAVIESGAGKTVRHIPFGWLVPGDKSFSWDRRDDRGWQVAPGFYRLQLSAQSSYGDKTTLKETDPFYLPLFYHEDSGGAPSRDAHLTQGRRSAEWGPDPFQTVATHPAEVVYRFGNLNASVQYELKAEFYNREGDYLKQSVTVDKANIVNDFDVPAGRTSLEWQPLPRETYSDGEIEVRITKVGGAGPATISQLWLREADYDPANPPVQRVNDAPLPVAFSLAQNYPNPFNPTTTIEFGVPDGATNTVTLKIYNSLGQVVNVLVREQLPPGRHSVIWNGRDTANQPIASGVYFYQLDAGSFRQVRKLVLMK